MNYTLVTHEAVQMSRSVLSLVIRNWKRVGTKHIAATGGELGLHRFMNLRGNIIFGPLFDIVNRMSFCKCD